MRKRRQTTLLLLLVVMIRVMVKSVCLDRSRLPAELQELSLLSTTCGGHCARYHYLPGSASRLCIWYTNATTHCVAGTGASTKCEHIDNSCFLRCLNDEHVVEGIVKLDDEQKVETPVQKLQLQFIKSPQGNHVQKGILAEAVHPNFQLDRRINYLILTTEYSASVQIPRHLFQKIVPTSDMGLLGLEIKSVKFVEYDVAGSRRLLAESTTSKSRYYDFLPNSLDTLKLVGVDLTYFRDSWKDFKRLKNLDLSENKITAIPSKAANLKLFPALADLRRLTLKKNDIRRMKSDFSKLEILELESNDFLVFPERVVGFDKLEYISLLGIARMYMTTLAYESLKAGTAGIGKSLTGKKLKVEMEEAQEQFCNTLINGKMRTLNLSVDNVFNVCVSDVGMVVTLPPEGGTSKPPTTDPSDKDGKLGAGVLILIPLVVVLTLILLVLLLLYLRKNHLVKSTNANPDYFLRHSNSDFVMNHFRTSSTTSSIKNNNNHLPTEDGQETVYMERPVSPALLVLPSTNLSRSSSTSSFVQQPYTRSGCSSIISSSSSCKTEQQMPLLMKDTPLSLKSYCLEYEDISLSVLLSVGCFGEVWLGTYMLTQDVVVKKMKARPIKRKKPSMDDPTVCTEEDETEGKDLLKKEEELVKQLIEQACIMTTISHRHIVRFIGISWCMDDSTLNQKCSLRQDDLEFVCEFVSHGDLRSYLQLTRQLKHNSSNSSSNNSISNSLGNNHQTWTAEKTTFLLSIVEALAYLHANKSKQSNPSNKNQYQIHMHRDLNSRNVLLDGTNLAVKLSLFAMTRMPTRSRTNLDALWYAPEIILDRNEITEMCDLYSLGILISELSTHKLPYSDAVSFNGTPMKQVTILQQIALGKILPALGETIPKPIFSIAMECLQYDPTKRPTMKKIYKQIKRYKSSLASQG